MSTSYVVTKPITKTNLAKLAKKMDWSLGKTESKSTFIFDGNSYIHYTLNSDHISLDRFGANDASHVIDVLAQELDADVFSELDDEYAEFFGFGEDPETEAEQSSFLMTKSSRT